METYDDKYKPLSLLLVEYKIGDPLGFVMAWFSMIPILFIVGLCTVILIRRDLTTVTIKLNFFLFTKASNKLLFRTDILHDWSANN